MSDRLKVLIVGGYGSFGRRLVGLLDHEPRLEIIVAGRSEAQAAAFCAERRALGAQAELSALALDRSAVNPAVLARLKPDLVADLSGPFQAYGANRYAFVRAVIEAGSDYCDIADDTAFVTEFKQLDDLAKARNCVALTGLSTCPALTGAMVAAIDQTGFEKVKTIVCGLAPSPHVAFGRAVIDAILSYAGKPVTVSDRGSKLTQRTGLVDARRLSIIVPGAYPLRHRFFTLVDVPDLTLLSALHRDHPAVWFGVSTAPAALHRALRWAARLVSWRLLPSLTPFARLIHWGSRTFNWGPAVGGMTVVLVGQAKKAAGGQSITRRLSLVAEGDSGPQIPVTGIVALIRRRLAGLRSASGARHSAGLLTFADYTPIFAQLGIRWAETDTTSGPATQHTHRAALYPALLGDAFNRLPERVRAMHQFAPGERSTRWHGQATITRGSNPVARLVATLFRFPAAAIDAPLTVRLDREEDGARRRETWTRTFAEKTFVSLQDLGTRPADAGTLIERFGPLGFRLAILTDDARLRLVPVSWRAFGIPMPRALMPKVDASEHADDGQFNFNVSIGLPMIGQIVHYRGTLERVGERLGATGTGHVDARHDRAKQS